MLFKYFAKLGECGLIFIFFLVFISPIIFLFFINLDISPLLATPANAGITGDVPLTNATGHWSLNIRELIVAGVNDFRLFFQLRQATSPRAILLEASFTSFALRQAAQNLFNDPNFIRENIDNWETFWNGSRPKGIILLSEEDTEHLIGNMERTASSLISDPNSYSSIYNALVSSFSNLFRELPLCFSNELVGDPILSLIVISLLLTLFVFILFFFFILCLIAYFYADSLSTRLSNRFLLYFIKFNKITLFIQLVLFSAIILYFLLYISYLLYNVYNFIN